MLRPDHGDFNRQKPSLIQYNVSLTNLAQILSVPAPTTPPSPPRKNGPSVGGKAANRGEEHLMDLVIQSLESLQVTTKYISINALHEGCYEAIGKALETYQKEREHNPSRLTYGQTLRRDGMLRKLRQWAKKSHFRERLAELYEPPNGH